MDSRDGKGGKAERAGHTPAARFFAPSIRASLLWLVAACVLPGLLGTAFLIDYFYHRERAKLEQNLLQTARALSQAVDRELAIAQTATTILSEGPFFANDDLPLAYKRANDLVRMQVGNTMVLSDADGKQVFNTQKPFGWPLPAAGNPEQLQRVFASGRPDISGVFTGAVTRRPLVRISVPVRQHGRIKYVLSVGILPERFEKILTEQQLPAGQVAAVLAGNGDFIARSAQSGQPGPSTGRRTTPAIVQRMQEVDEGIVEAETSAGIPSYVALSRVSAAGWHVGVAAPKSGLLGEMRTIVLYLSLAMTALLVAGSALARVIGRRIADAVRALVAPALALGSGRPVAVPRLPIRETDEVAVALNAASALIRQRTDERDRAFDSLRLAQSVFDNTQETISVTDLDCRILAVNPAFSAVTEYASDEVVGKRISLLQSGRHERSFYQQMWQSIGDSGGWQGAIWNRRKSGDIYQEWLVISTVHDEHGRPAHYIGISMDMTRMNHVETRMEYLAHHDALTGLPNRLLLHSRLEHTLERAQRDGSGCAVLFIDLDRFKPVNDTWGHAAGDELLQLAVARMKERLRDVDTLARLGGDEFVAVLDSPCGADEAAQVADDLIARLQQPFRLRDGQELAIGGSIGISLYPEHGSSSSTLVANADAALYRAKAAGRGRWQIHRPERG